MTNANPDKLKQSSRLQHIISIALILVVAGMIAWLSNRYVLNVDWTANNRNSLTPASEKLLRSMSDDISIKAFVYPDNKIRKEITLRIEPYQRVKENITLEFIDPAKNPQLARDMDVAASGEVFIEYQGRRESLRALSEQTLTTALQRLAFSGERVVRFLTGHGERNIESDGQADYKLFVDELRNKGLKVEALNLARNLRIPENTSALVIASPRRNLLEGEVKLIREYVQNGGNLMWLADPAESGSALAGLESLTDDIDVDWQNGTVLYPDFQVLGLSHPAIMLVTDYPPHPINQDMLDITLFPFAGAIKGIEESTWKQDPFLTSRPLAWLETGPLEGELDFNEEDGDTAGPFMVGLAMERNAPDADVSDTLPEGDDSDEELLQKLEADKNRKIPKQRVAVVADGDFLANGFVGNLGNLQLGLNIVQWLSNRDEQISVHIPPAPDNKLFLAPWAPTLFGLLFVLAMPVVLIGIGVSRWWLRRRR